MKGLLIKDFCMMMKYCRTFLLIAVIFAVTGAFYGSENPFFTFYPCVLAGMVPVTLLAYDERSGWEKYSAAMPVSRAQVVSGKYVVGLCANAAMLIITAIAQFVGMKIKGGVAASELLTLLAAIFAVGCLASSIIMPVIFRLGVEKGRIAYYLIIGFFCALIFVARPLLEELPTGTVTAGAGARVAAIAGVAVIYALSWLLSIAFYKKREL